MRIEKGMQGMALHPFLSFLRGEKGEEMEGMRICVGVKWGCGMGRLSPHEKKLKKEFDVWS